MTIGFLSKSLIKLINKPNCQLLSWGKSPLPISYYYTHSLSIGFLLLINAAGFYILNFYLSKWKLNWNPVSNLPISALQKSCCGCAGWQLHPSTTPFMPAPSKRITQSPRHTLRSWDMAMTTLAASVPPLSEHSATSSEPVKIYGKQTRPAVSRGGR